MKITDFLASRCEMAPKEAKEGMEFNESPGPQENPIPLAFVRSNRGCFTCALGLTYAEVVKLMPSVTERYKAPASIMNLLDLDKKPPGLSLEYNLPSPIIGQCLPLRERNAQQRLSPPHQFGQENQPIPRRSVQNCHINRLNIIRYNWRNPAPTHHQEMKGQMNESNSQKVEGNPLEDKSVDLEQTKMDASPADKTECLALCESSSPPSKLRSCSESSLSSEDSVVAFDRSSAPDQSDLSSDAYEESDDDETSTSNGSSKTLERLSESESEEEVMKAKNDGEVAKSDAWPKAEMSVEADVPLIKRLRKLSGSSDSSESDRDDSEESGISEAEEEDGEFDDDKDGSFKYNLDDEDEDDDFIVFEEETGDKQEAEKIKKQEEESDEEESEDETDNIQVISTPRRRRYPEKIKPEKSKLKVRFAEVDDICLLYDDEDCRLARISEWQEKATDSIRFRVRIKEAAAVLDPVLAPAHRLKIQEKLKIMAESNAAKHRACVVNGRH